MILLLAALLLAPAASALEAAAGKADITPDLASERTYLAGFGAKGRRPAGVHDRLHARAVLLREGKNLVGIVSLDLLGFAREDVEDLRRLAGFDAEGRRLLVHATHQHSGPDTLGLWGPLLGVSGVNASYQARIKREIARLLKELEAGLEPVEARGGAGKLDPRGLCADSRDPQVIDPNVAVLRLKGRGGRAVATVVSWACHPEVLGRENLLLTADYPGPLCARVEEKTDGACVFLNGAIGGLLTPDVREENFYEAARIGRAVADAALALETRPGEGLSYRFELIRVPVENSRYRLFLPALTAGHRLLAADGAPLPRLGAWTLAARHLLFGLRDDLQPWIESEVSLARVGPALLLGLPGEAFPELAIGGYDGRHAAEKPVVAPGNPDPPRLAGAPKGPYLRERLRAPAPMIVGLANDELGYLVPAYDFKTRPGRFMLPRLPGHYEETNSIGVAATKLVVDAAERLLSERP